MGNKSYVSLALSLTSHPLPEECSAGAGVLAGGKVPLCASPLGKLTGKAEVMGVGGLAGSHSQAERNICWALPRHLAG